MKIDILLFLIVKVLLYNVWKLENLESYKEPKKTPLIAPSDNNLGLSCSLTSQVALVLMNPPANAGDTQTHAHSLGWEDPPKKGMVTCSGILAWRIPWTEEPSRL